MPSCGVSTRTVLLAARSTRSFAIGLLGVALPLALEAATEGARVATVLAAGLAGATALVALGGAGAGDGRRLRALALYTVLFSAGAWFVVASPYPELAALVGAVSLQPNISPFAPLEHATLADGASDDERTAVFARYNSLSAISLALGALAASAPYAPQTLCCAAAAVVGLATPAYAVASVAAAPPTGAAGLAATASADRTLAKCTLRRRILSLAGLFACDSFAGGFVITALFAHWLSTRFGGGPGYAAVLGPLFFVNQVLAAASFPASTGAEESS